MLRPLLVGGFILLPVLNALSSFQLSTENLLKRSGKPISWRWNENLLKSPDTFRRRRFLGDDAQQPWWKEMQADTQDFASSGSVSNPLTSSEESHHEKLQNTPPFDTLENLPAPLARTEFEDSSLPSHREIEEPLLGEVIIDELHRPSKLEFESATKRLKDVSSNSLSGQITSSVEYVVPSVELVEPHVEYANPYEVITTTPSVVPEVEYVVPSVEFVEPVIEYEPQNNISDKYSIVTFGNEGSGLEVEDESIVDENLPVEESIRIGRKELLRLYSHKKNQRERSYATKTHSETEKSERFSTRRRFYRHQPIIGVPEESYPTLEILPVVHFACEEYAEPGYYADISSRCQMFHICHDNGQRSSFLCPVGTVFNQEYLVCDWWYNVDCRNSVRHQSPLHAFNTNNEQLLAAGSGISDGHGFPELTNSSAILSHKTSPTLKKSNSLIHQSVDFKTRRNDLDNLSRKAINYPIGYAILLREHIKSTTQKMAEDDILAIKDPMASNKDPETVEFVENVNAVVKFKKRLRMQPNSKNFPQQQLKYFGGSKPFADPKPSTSVKLKPNIDSSQRDNDSLKYVTMFNGYNVENMTLYRMVPEIKKFSAVHRSDEIKNENLEIKPLPKQKSTTNRSNTVFDHAYWEKVFAANNFSNTYDSKLNYDVVKSTLSYTVSETSEIDRKVYNRYPETSVKENKLKENLVPKSSRQYSFEESFIDNYPINFINPSKEGKFEANGMKMLIESDAVKDSVFKYGDRLRKINKTVSLNVEKPSAKREKVSRINSKGTQSSPLRLVLQDIQVQTSTQSDDIISIRDDSMLSRNSTIESEIMKKENSGINKAINVADNENGAIDVNVPSEAPAYIHQYVKNKNRPNENYYSIRQLPDPSQTSRNADLFHSNSTTGSNSNHIKIRENIKELYYIDNATNIGQHYLSSKTTPSSKIYYINRVPQTDDSFFKNVTNKVNNSNGGYRVVKKVKIKKPSPRYFMLPEKIDNS